MDSVTCSSCQFCNGITILQFIICDKVTHAVISISEQPKYKCEIFDLVDLDEDQCFNFRPLKDTTINTIEWTEH